MLYTQEEDEDEDIDGVPMNNNNIPMMDFSEHMARLAQGQNYDGAVVRGMVVTNRVGYDDDDIDGVPLAYEEEGEGDSVDGAPL